MERQEWHKRRRLSIGASEAPTILGVSPYKHACPMAIAWGKRGLTPLPDDEADTVGHRLERLGREWLEERAGCAVDFRPERDEFALFCTGCGERRIETCPCGAPLLHANLDGRITYDSVHANYEHKALSRGNPSYDDWKGDCVPLSVQVQAQQQMLCSGMGYTLIVVFDGPRLDWSIRLVSADGGFQLWLVQRLGDWWRRFVTGEEDPDPAWSDATAKAVRERWPVREPRTIELGDNVREIAEQWVEQKSTARTATKEARKLATQLEYHMAGADHGAMPDGSALTAKIDRAGRLRLTYKQVS